MSMLDGYSKAGLIFGNSGGGGGGTTNYTQLTNKPKINGTTVVGDLDADALGLANCKYYTLVVGETNKFVDTDGAELAVADVYADMLQFVTEDKSNIAIINVTFANEDEETGHTATLAKLLYSTIDLDEGGLQFYAKAGNVEVTSLVTEDEVIFKQRDADFIVRGILTMTSETTATISDLTENYDNIMEAIDNGSNVKLIVVMYSSQAYENNAVIEFNHIAYNKIYNIIEFETIKSDRLYQVIFDENSQDVIITKIQAKPTVATITILASAWTNNTQTISVEDITSDALVQVSPVPSDVEKYANAKIICTAQGEGTLTFTCGSVPANDIDVTVINWG